MTCPFSYRAEPITLQNRAFLLSGISLHRREIRIQIRLVTRKIQLYTTKPRKFPADLSTVGWPILSHFLDTFPLSLSRKSAIDQSIDLGSLSDRQPSPIQRGTEIFSCDKKVRPTIFFLVSHRLSFAFISSHPLRVETLSAHAVVVKTHVSVCP